MDEQLGAGMATVGETEQPALRAGAEHAGWRVAAPLWGAAIVVAAVGTAIGFDAEPGVNWGVWTTLAALVLLWFAGRGAARGDSSTADGRDVTGGAPGSGAPGRHVDRVGLWCIALAVVVAWGAAVTANDLFQAFIFLACVVLLATATRVTGGVSGSRVGAGMLAGAPLTAFGYATVEAGRQSAAAISGARGERYAPVVRGLVLALPVAGVFALVLVGADPMLSAWRDALFDALRHLEFIPRAVFFIGLGTIVLGAYGLAARRGGAVGATASGAPTLFRVGPMDRRLIVGAVAAVFGVFLAVQPAYLFRDTDTLQVSGMTYTEYAHRGFTELTIAATLCVVLVIMLDRYQVSDRATRLEGMSGVRRYWGTLLLIGEVLVVLVSAFHRLTVYEAAYGYTMLRLYVQAYVIGVGITLVLLAREVAGRDGTFDARRAARRTGVVAMAFLAVFSFANPEAWVVARDGARYHATGKLDTAYLASLSLNAGPAIVALAEAASPACAEYIRQDLGVAYGRTLTDGEPRRWFEWNLRRARALAALQAARIHTPTPVPRWVGTGCNESPASGR